MKVIILTYFIHKKMYFMTIVKIKIPKNLIIYKLSKFTLPQIVGIDF
jgi:hypothetical protein